MLNEQKLLQAPESEYMSDTQLEFFRQRLKTMRLEISQELDQSGASFVVQEQGGDEVDRAGREAGWLVASRITRQRSSLLHKIDAALARIEDGSYGYCEETGEPIGLPRLLARPTAPLCVEAQEKQERLNRLSRISEPEASVAF